ncbi:hypothetical protein N9D70_01280 [bacterium]|nr:hypothetical protein [bacterium]
MLKKTLGQEIIMKEFSLVCLIFCLLGCVPTLQNQSAVNPPSADKTTKEIADTQECARPALSADKVVVTDSIVDDKPNKIVTAAMAGVWGGYFLANISLPFAAVVLPIADLETGEDAYLQKLKDNFTKQADTLNNCELK